MVHLGEVGPTIWDDIVEHMEQTLKDFSGEEILPNWRKDANHNKFNRELIEKYGYFKDIILHPKFQSTKLFLEENADFNFFLGDPLMPLATAVIILFLLNKRISFSAMGLVGAFIFNVNPLYVTLFVLGIWVFSTFRQPKQYRSSKPLSDAAKYKPSVIAQEKLIKDPTAFDHVLIGGDLGTLFTAALLARNGHRCCVLQPLDGPKHTINVPGAPCKAPIRNTAVAKVEKYQALLDMVQSLNSTKRVVFHPVGTQENGYTSTVVHTLSGSSSLSSGIVVQKVGANGAPSSSSPTRVTAHRSGLGAALSLRAGEFTLATDISSRVPIYKAQLVLAFSRFRQAMGLITSFLFSHIVSYDVWEKSTVAKSDGADRFRDISTSSVEQVLYQCDLGPTATSNNNDNEQEEKVNNEEEAMSTRQNRAVAADRMALFHALSSVAAVGADEALPAGSCSALSLATALSAESGVYYPAGGAEALELALTRAVRAAGGAVYKDVEVGEVVLEEVIAATAQQSGISKSVAAAQPVVKAVGVQVKVVVSEGNNHSKDSSTSSTNGDNGDARIIYGSRSIVSGMGTLCTYSKLLPHAAVSERTRTALSLLSEARPKVTVVYWLQGTVAELGLSSTDYVQAGRYTETSGHLAPGLAAPRATASNSTAAAVDPKETYARSFMKVWSPSAKDPSWNQSHRDDVQVVVVELDAAEPLVSSTEFEFTIPPLKNETEEEFSFDNSDAAATSDVNQSSKRGPLVYYSNNQEDSITKVNHPDYASILGKAVTMSKTKKDRYKQVADEKLWELYPKSEGKEVYVHVEPPVLGGHVLSNTPAKFASQISAKTDIQNFFLTGRDVATVGLSGDIQGGWVGANAILGYSLTDLTTNSNIVTDLRYVRRQTY